ncbi:MAG: hypothetical protein U1C33_02660, partial [Candidatus Cloacimonadaceae bacterium]|nr:hypothetical protein [Candidatus Cloacimonadaceae bacterium]
MPTDGITLENEAGSLVGYLANNQIATSFKLWLGTNTPPNNVYNCHEVSSVFNNAGGGVWFYFFAAPLSGLSLAPGTTYYWRAEAINPGGAGPSSPTWSFITSGSAVPGNALLVSPANAAIDVSVDANMAWSAPASGPAP